MRAAWWGQDITQHVAFPSSDAMDVDYVSPQKIIDIDHGVDRKPLRGILLRQEYEATRTVIE
jgi:hypothetical protein